MPVVKLSQEIISSGLQCPANKIHVEYCDMDLPGLYVEVRSTSRGTGIFRYRYKDKNGKTCHEPIGTTLNTTLNEARKKAKQFRAELELGRDRRSEERARDQCPTVSQYFHGMYLPYVTPRKRSVKRDIQLFARIEAKFGNRRLIDIGRKEVVDFHASLLKEGLSPASADLHASLFRRMWFLAVDWQVIERNVLAKFPLFRVPNQREHNLSPEQLRVLVETLKMDSRRGVCQIAMYLLSTGARLNEALSAKWVHIDLPNRRWTIPAATAKGKRVRYVPLNDSALMVLEEVGTRGLYESVFISRQTGKPYTAVFRVWNRIRQKAGLPSLRLHDLRHEYASQLVNGGRSLFEVQVLLGHASPVMSQRYSHLSSATLQHAAEAASVLLPVGADRKLSHL